MWRDLRRTDVDCTKGRPHAAPCPHEHLKSLDRKVEASGPLNWRLLFLVYTLKEIPAHVRALAVRDRADASWKVRKVSNPPPPAPDPGRWEGVTSRDCPRRGVASEGVDARDGPRRPTPRVVVRVPGRAGDETPSPSRPRPSVPPACPGARSRPVSLTSFRSVE